MSSGPGDGWWIDPGFLAFDTETTGVDPANDRIVSAAVTHFRGGAPVEDRSWLLRIDIPIPPGSTQVHGIDDERSQREGIEQAEGLVQIRDALAQGDLPVVAFNATFDIDMLNANLRRVGAAPLAARAVICPLVLDKQFNKYVRGSNQRRLGPTAARYGIDLSDEDWHGALADAHATGRILLAEFNAYADLRDLDAVTLANRIQQWRGEQEADFQAWLASRPPRT